MSVQNDFAKKLIKAQSDIKELKATQILGGSNMDFHLYQLPTVGGTLNYPSYQNILVFVYAEVPFPLVSVEMEFWEMNTNSAWTKVTNPYGTQPIPYNGAKNSLCTYSFYEGDSIVGLAGGATKINIHGKEYSIFNPNLYLYNIEVSNNRSSSTKQYKFDNIKVRCSSAATVFCEPVIIEEIFE